MSRPSITNRRGSHAAAALHVLALQLHGARVVDGLGRVCDVGVILIDVPSLSDRKDDISALVEKFLKDISDEYGSKKKTIDAKAIKLLESHPWAGNIRELRNVVERLVIMAGDTIQSEDVKKYL